jgi:hypothetical protein
MEERGGIDKRKIVALALLIIAVAALYFTELKPEKVKVAAGLKSKIEDRRGG